MNGIYRQFEDDANVCFSEEDKHYVLHYSLGVLYSNNHRNHPSTSALKTMSTRYPVSATSNCFTHSLSKVISLDLQHRHQTYPTPPNPHPLQKTEYAVMHRYICPMVLIIR